MNIYEIKTIGERIRGNAYVGRGIVAGKTADGTRAAIAYFIMGRSENSRNRVFVEDGEGIRTQAFDPSKMVDPHLIIYAPVRVLGNKTIVTNGDQTDTVYDFMQNGQTFEDALRTRTFEDDRPNWTPRISGLVRVADGKASYKLSIIKSDDGDESSVLRYFYEYAQPKAGEGHFIHTYQCDGNPIPSFAGEPEKVALHGDIEQLALDTWMNLNEDNKVSLYVSYISLADGSSDTIIINKHDQEEEA